MAQEKFGKFVGGAQMGGAPAMGGRDMTERERLARLRYREAAYRRIMGNHYIFYHEELQRYVANSPGVWHKQALRDWTQLERVKACIVKGRQVGETSKTCLQMLDVARYTPGAVCLIWNMNHAAAEATLASRVSAVLKQTYPALAADINMCSISASHIWFKRKEGAGGDSFIYAGKTQGRGATPVMTLATEFPQVCANDPARAREHLDGTVSGAQYGTHILEGTASHLASGSQMNHIMEEAIERQRKGYKLTTEDWIGYFYSWWMMPGRYVPDKDWDEREVMDKEALDYFKWAADPTKEYMIGREVRTGGIQLTEGQKRFWWNRYKGEKQKSIEAMQADYPLFLSESLKVGTKAHYLVPLIRAALDENRVGNYPVQHGVPVHVATDIGWNDESVAIFAQPEQGLDSWRVLDFFAAPRLSSHEFIERIARYQWRAQTGCRPVVWLPHDAGKKTHTNLKMTGDEDIRVYDDFVDDRRFDVRPPVEQPRKKSDVFSAIRNGFPRLRFHGEHSRELFGLLQGCKIMEISTNGVLTHDLDKTRGRHCHDALGILMHAMRRRQRMRDRGGEGYDYVERRLGMFADGAGMRF